MFANELDMQISQAKVKPDGNVEVVLMVMLKDVINCSPLVKVAY